LGNDIYVVDNTFDIVVETADQGTDTVQSNSTYTLSSEVEKLTLLGIGSINGTGNELDNVIIGNSGNNILNGLLGVDTMIGGEGNDTYVVNNELDIVVETAGQGIDTVQSNITYTLGDNVENLTLLGTGDINGTGNDLDNIIIGNDGHNTLVGGMGNDIYMVDVLDIVVENVGEGTDVVYSSIAYTLGENLENLNLTGKGSINGTGNQLNNYLVGNGSDNILDGGLGADTMEGGLGNDTYFVDDLLDVVVEKDSALDKKDTVKSSITYTLGANVENLTLLGTGDINGTGNNLDNTIIGNSGNNRLKGYDGNDILYGGTGNDNLDSGYGNDILYGDEGDDSLDGYYGNDTLYGGAGDDSLDGGYGNDTYIFGVGCGNDTIYNSSSYSDVDILRFQGLRSSDVTFTKKDSYDLLCTITGTGETVTIDYWFLSDSYKLDKLQFSDGTLTSTQVSQKIV